MGRIGRLIQTAIEKFIVQTVEAYAGVNLSADTYAPSGDDSPPLPEDRIVLVQVDGTGNFVAVGVLTESQGAKPGEKILFSRDENGEVKAILKLLNDGKIELSTPEAISVDNKKGISVKSKEKIEIGAQEMAMTADKVTVEGKGISVKSKEKIEIGAQEMAMTADKVTVEGKQTVLTGGRLQCKGSATPSGSGPFCAIPSCLFTGAPQCGTDVLGT